MGEESGGAAHVDSDRRRTRTHEVRWRTERSTAIKGTFHNAGNTREHYLSLLKFSEQQGWNDSAIIADVKWNALKIIDTHAYAQSTLRLLAAWTTHHYCVFFCHNKEEEEDTTSSPTWFDWHIYNSGATTNLTWLRFCARSHHFRTYHICIQYVCAPRLVLSRLRRVGSIPRPFYRYTVVKLNARGGQRRTLLRKIFSSLSGKCVDKSVVLTSDDES